MATQRENLMAEILVELSKALQNKNNRALSELHAKIFPNRMRSFSRQEPMRKPARAVDEETAKRFSEFPSREALQEHLEKEFPEKLAIANLARSISVPVTKADNYETLSDKIVDATVGYRLRSKAIRGRD